jgi:hypothetical protein
MTRSELDTTLKWAEIEGWNPGLNDASIFWATDSDGFLVAEIDGEMVGTGSVIRNQPNSFFLALFMIRQDLRGSGLGRQAFQNWRFTVQRSLRGSTGEAHLLRQSQRLRIFSFVTFVTAVEWHQGRMFILTYLRSTKLVWH